MYDNNKKKKNSDLFFLKKSQLLEFLQQIMTATFLIKLTQFE